jgi:molybdate transport system substrate-binding protein
MRAALLAAASAVATVAIAACGEDEESSADGTSAERPELVVFAATSLTTAFEEYGAGFDRAEVRFSFAGSDELAAQIRQGVAPDVYAAANTSLPDELAAGVPAGSDIAELADLERPGTTVAIGDPEVPVGAYTREVLDALGPQASQAILGNVATEEPDVGGIVAKVNQGAVDAGFIYRSDVAASGGAIEEVEIPASAGPDVAYGIAISSDAAEPDLAREFVAGAIDGAGQEILLDLGFGPVPG